MRRTYYLVSLLLQKGVYPENLPLFCHASSKSASFFFFFNFFICFDLLHRFVCAFILRRKMRGIIFMTTLFLRQSKGWTAKSSQWLEPDGKPLAFLFFLFFFFFFFLTHLLASSMLKEPWSKPAFVSAAEVYVALCFMELLDQSNTVLDSIHWRIIFWLC